MLDCNQSRVIEQGCSKIMVGWLVRTDYRRVIL